MSNLWNSLSYWVCDYLRNLILAEREGSMCVCRKGRGGEGGCGRLCVFVDTRSWDVRSTLREERAKEGVQCVVTAWPLSPSLPRMPSLQPNIRLYAWITHSNVPTLHSPPFTPLSPSSSVRVWDVRPFAPADRQLKVFHGHKHGFEKVSVPSVIM